jgi:hypothetical protein
MIAAIFSSLLQSELYSLLVSSIGKEIIDHRCRSAVVTHHSQSNCLVKNRCGLIF